MTDPSPGPAGAWRCLGVVPWLVTVGLWMALGAAGAAEVTPDNRACLRCHGMATLAYRDGATGHLIDLSIDPLRLTASAHGKLTCVECHARDYGQYPHPPGTRHEALECVGCHREARARSTEPFEAIAGQYARSIHATATDPKLQGFGCHSCHDPHVFRVSTVGRALAEIVRDDNRVCLSCHEDVGDPLPNVHQWLPKREAHWAAVRCVECHTPMASATDEVQRVSHQVLPAKESNKTCVNCHSGNQRLLGRLYAYRSEEDLARHGWFAKAVFNEAYVVGMSRSPLIDRLSLLFMGLAVLGVIAHGAGRYWAYRRFRERQS